MRSLVDLAGRAQARASVPASARTELRTWDKTLAGRRAAFTGLTRVSVGGPSTLAAVNRVQYRCDVEMRPSGHKIHAWARKGSPNVT